jgi:hypothetical protein
MPNKTKKTIVGAMVQETGVKPGKAERSFALAFPPGAADFDKLGEQQ